MASIRKDILIAAPPETVWAAIRDVGAVHERLAPGFVTDTRLDGDARIVTFANGAVVRELLIDVDDAARRVAYAAVGGFSTHHNASMQVLAEPEGSRLVWTTDLLPDEAAGPVGAMIEQGSEVMKRTLERTAGSPRAFLDALHAAGPAADRAGKMDLYGWLVGSWELDVSRYLDDGSERRIPGTWHFGWALEGRAVQDVWIVAPRYGTTLRTYDPAIDAWHIQWTEPVSQSYLTMIGRRQGGDIVQDGKDAAGNPIRWSFTEITPNSFRWLGETSRDGGATWRLDVAFLARRTG
jgi:carbon monoxide dehydrogenase subunit G